MTLSADQMHATIIGNGPPLLMLHGWGRSSTDLRPLGEMLAQDFLVHLIDLPGFGKTEAPPIEGWDTQQYADLILEYCKKNSLSQIHLLGHSFGGRISLRIAAQRQSLVQKLVLVDSHGLKAVRPWNKKVKIQAIRWSVKFAKSVDKTFSTDIFNKKFVNRFGSPDYRNAGVLKNTFVKVISEDQTNEVKKISAPTLLLWGAEDTETPLEMAQRFKALIKNSKLIALQGKGHNPFEGMGAHLCAHHIQNFLRGTKEGER